MVWAGVVRAGLFASVTITWWLGLLTFAQLVAVALLLGAATVMFDLASQAYLPVLVGRPGLVEGNAMLASSQSVAQVAGPGVGGVLIQGIGVAGATLVNGAAYAVSALLLSVTSTHEPSPTPQRDARLHRQVLEGLRFVLAEPTLRMIALCAALSNLAVAAVVALQVLFLTRGLGLTTGAVGVVLAVGAVGGVIGAITACTVITHFGQERSLWLIPLITWPLALLTPLTQPGWPVALAAAGLVIRSYGFTVFNVANISYRQSICPDHLLGRMNATIRFLTWSTMPVGALLAGVLGETLGVHAALWIACAALALTPLPLLITPLR
jgi:predicted MFS family arabinose efflux permease